MSDHCQSLEMDLDNVTHITDSTQNDMPIDPSSSLLLVMQASDERTNTQRQQPQCRVHGQMRHWRGNPERPWQPNTESTIDSSSVTSIGQAQTERRYAHARETHFTSTEAVRDDNATHPDTTSSSVGDMPRQRLEDYPDIIDFFLETSLVGVGDHLDSSSAPRQRVQRVAANSGPSSGSNSNERFWSTKVLYYCTSCNFSSTARDIWEKHEREQHLLPHDPASGTATVDLMCYFCGVNAISIKERAEHIAKHFWFERYKKADWEAKKRHYLDAQRS